VRQSCSGLVRTAMNDHSDDLELELEPEALLVPEQRPRPAEPHQVVGCLGGAPTPFAIYLHLRTVEQILAGLPEGQRVEAGGLLVGRPYQDRGEDYLAILGAVPAELAEGRRLCLTFTHEAWDAMLRDKDAYFPNERIIGWYHTHPGLGVFLSGPDLFIHQHFFPDPIQVALVIDPDDFTWGIFCWHRDQIQAAVSYHIYGEPDGDYERLATLLNRYAPDWEVEL